MIFGVCKGLAGYLDFSVFWTRVIFLVLLFLTGLWPIVGLYILAALLMKPEPMLPISSFEDKEFYDSYSHSRSAALQRLKRTYDKMEHRIQRMEHIVTAREYDWDKRLRERS